MYKISFRLLLLILLVNTIHTQNYVEKKGGICFRVDDNHDLDKFHEYAAIFDNYNQKFSFALNLAEEKFSNDLDGSYRAGIKAIQNNGHEIMDHTPNHRTNYFNTKFAISDYRNVDSNNIAGVDHIIDFNPLKRKICLEFMPVDTTSAAGFGKLDIISSGDSIIIQNYSWPDIAGKNIFYLYLPEIEQLIFLPSNGIGAKQPIEDFWRDLIVLENSDSLYFYGFTNYQVHLTLDAIKVLADESRKLALIYDLIPPKTWIQPGGLFPIIYKEELKAAIGNTSLNYVAGASYPEEAKQVFNEYNPNDDLNFAIQWGDFREDEEDLEWNKNIIADKYAKHQMLVGHSHFYSYDHWEDYLERTDSLIAWAINKDIPIKTYSEWADILYNQIPDPYENIFPPLNIDLDENGVPDGYGNILYPISNYVGTWETDDEAPSPGGYCYSISGSGGIAYSQDIGGIEKGKNDFEIWTKGAVGDSIEVTFKYSYFHDNEKITFKFPANTSDWTKYSLSQSLNGNTELIVPDTMSTIFVYIDCSDYSSGDVKISGMTLSKFIEKRDHYLDLNVHIEGPYNKTTHQMDNSLHNIIPKNSPFSIDSQSVTDISPNVVDWILIELRKESALTKIISSRSAFLLKNGNIVDTNGIDPVKFTVEDSSYYIVIKHRNHLQIMSSSAVDLNY